MTRHFIADTGPLAAPLLSKRDRPMSLAGACLVRLAELFDDAEVITLDRDFSIYRKHGRQTVPLIAPFSR